LAAIQYAARQVDHNLLRDETTPEPLAHTRPKFNIADVEDYDRSTVGKITLPSREERNARR
jgi:hypothetical protein